MIPDSFIVHLIIILISFFVLTKSANFLVDGSVAIAYRFNIPKMIIGIVLVSFATTTPEFTVSLLSALKGYPEIALGNAIGSVIADDALALALGMIVAPTVIAVDSKILKSAGIFLIIIDIVAFILAFNGTVSRFEGAFLIIILIGYFGWVIIHEKRRKNGEAAKEIDKEVMEHVKGTILSQVLKFVGGVVGVIIASRFLVDSSVWTATYFKVPQIIIGLTLVAVGTSLPEIATSIIASRRGHGDLALGDIIGADILNILWIIGSASLVRPIKVAPKIIYFAFPAMIIVVVTMLLFARHKYRLTRFKGIVLVLMYIAYLVSSLLLFHTPAAGS